MATENTILTRTILVLELVLLKIINQRDLILSCILHRYHNLPPRHQETFRVGKTLDKNVTVICIIVHRHHHRHQSVKFLQPLHSEKIDNNTDKNHVNINQHMPIVIHIGVKNIFNMQANSQITMLSHFDYHTVCITPLLTT